LLCDGKKAWNKEMKNLIVNEIYFSLQGEGPHQGLKTVFLRLQGCNLKCLFCDTEYAQDPKDGKEIELDEIVGTIDRMAKAVVGCNYVCITGGEPLIQPVNKLIAKLCTLGLCVDIETNGSLPLVYMNMLEVEHKCTTIMDIKTPCSGMHRKMHFYNLSRLRPTDIVKFVCRDVEDIRYAEGVLREYPTRAQLYISPVWNTPFLKDIASKVMFSVHPFRLQIQLHKQIWGNKRGV